MKAFFDIDTQLDFLYPAGALYAPGCERVIPNVAKLNAHAVAQKIALISSTCAHTETPDEFRVWPPHCVMGTQGAAFHPDLRLPREVTVIADDKKFATRARIDRFAFPPATTSTSRSAFRLRNQDG